MKPAAVRYEFGPFVLIPSEQVLLRSGQPLRLARKDFDLLVALVERAGHLVRKEELLSLVWPDAFVEEGNLTKHISTLRKALGELAESQAIVETVPRVGFRFVPRVRRVEAGEEASSAPPSPSRRATVSMVLFAIALSAVVVGAAVWWTRTRQASARDTNAPAQRWVALAVLPFTTLGDVDETDPLGVGLADGIITRLSGQKLLPVRPTSAVRGYVGRRRPDVKTAARALNADVVLEGHVQRAGDLVRVTVQLSDVAAGAPVWADTFDEPSTSLFRLEDAIAGRVAGALRLQLGAAEQARLRRHYTENAAAYNAYLTGRAALVRYTPEGTRVAIASFERALALDPAYALARAGLAVACADMYLRFAPERELGEWGARAEREAAEALASDPDLAEAHAARAAVLRKRDFDWEQAIDESRRALTLNPNLDQPHLVAAAAFYHLGLMEQALVEADLGKRGGGDRVEPLRIEALVALFSADFAAARRRLEQISRMSDRAIGDVYLGLASYYSGDSADARRLLETLAADSSASTASRAGAALAGILAASHDTAGARRALARVLSRSYRDHHVAYSVGAALAQLGDLESAVQWLRRAADTGFPCDVWYARDPLLAPLRNVPAYIALAADLAARHDAAARRYASP